VRTRPDQNGAPAVTGQVQQPRGHAQVQLAQARDERRAEDQRAVEDVVAVEVLAAGQGEDHRDHRHLEQRRGDLRQPRPASALGVEVYAGEHQHGHQVGKRAPLLGLVPDDRVLVVAGEQQLDQQGREQRGDDADVVERQQRRDPSESLEGLKAQQHRKQRRALTAHIAVRIGLRRPWLPAARGLSLLDRHDASSPIFPFANGSRKRKLWRHSVQGRRSAGL
jgi:hypothetical protein